VLDQAILLFKVSAHIVKELGFGSWTGFKDLSEEFSYPFNLLISISGNDVFEVRNPDFIGMRPAKE
jgi:hypothetical protein